MHAFILRVTDNLEEYISLNRDMIFGFANVIGENYVKYSESGGSIKKSEKVSCFHEAQKRFA